MIWQNTVFWKNWVVYTLGRDKVTPTCIHVATLQQPLFYCAVAEAPQACGCAFWSHLSQVQVAFKYRIHTSQRIS